MKKYSTQAQPLSTPTVHQSIALLGLALSVGTTGMLLQQPEDTQVSHTVPTRLMPQTADLGVDLSSTHDSVKTKAPDRTEIIWHEVQSGETLWQLTQNYNLDAAVIAASNKISAATPLEPGQKLAIPPVEGLVLHPKSGETIEKVAAFYDVSVEEIQKFSALDSLASLDSQHPIVVPGKVAKLLAIQEEDAKQRLIAEREQLKAQLTALEPADQADDYKVQKGDNIEAIAKKHDIAATDLVKANHLKNPNWLEQGQVLQIPQEAIETVAYVQNPELPKFIPTLSEKLAAQKIDLAPSEWQALHTVNQDLNNQQAATVPNADPPNSLVAIATRLGFLSIGGDSSDLKDAAIPEPEILTDLSEQAIPEVEVELPVPISEAPKPVKSVKVPQKIAALPVQESPVPVNTTPELVQPVEVVKEIAPLPVQESSTSVNTTPELVQPVEVIEKIATAPVLEASVSVAPVPEPVQSVEVVEKVVAAPTPKAPVLVSSSIKPVQLAVKPEKVATWSKQEPKLPTADTIPLVAEPTQAPLETVEKVAVAPAQKTELPVAAEQVPSAVKEVEKVAAIDQAVVQPTPSFAIPQRVAALTTIEIVRQPGSIAELLLPPAQVSTEPTQTVAASKIKAPILPTLKPIDRETVPKVAAAPSLPSVAVDQPAVEITITKARKIEVLNPVTPQLKSTPPKLIGFPSLQSPLAIEQAASTLAAAPVLLPEAEARMVSVEVKQLEKEVNKLREAIRLKETEKVAAATRTPAPRPEQSFDRDRQAIATPSEISRLAPELPQLNAAAYLPEPSNYGIATDFVWPAQGIMTSGFGWRWGRIHQGVDIAAPVGTPIWAAASGVIESAGWNNGGYGNMIDIRHPNGTITRYAHMNALYMKAGQTVTQGQVIGEMGSTGYSTGPHLHFEVRPGGGVAVNPINYLASARRRSVG